VGVFALDPASYSIIIY